MLLTLSGIVALNKFLHSLKASLPMLVTLSGIVILDKLSEYLKAPSAIDIVPSNNVIEIFSGTSLALIYFL